MLTQQSLHNSLCLLLCIQRSESTFLSFNLLPSNPDFKRPSSRSLSKTLWEKKRMLLNSIFFFSNNVFYPLRDTNVCLKSIYFFVCKYFLFGRVQNLVVWLAVQYTERHNLKFVQFFTIFR